MRFYVHYEGQPDFTLVVKDWGKGNYHPNENTATFDVLKQIFIDAYNKKWGAKSKLTVANTIVNTQRKKRIHLQAIVSKEVKNGEDVFIEVDQNSPEPQTPVQRDIPIREPRPVSTISSSNVEKHEDFPDFVTIIPKPAAFSPFVVSEVLPVKGPNLNAQSGQENAVKVLSWIKQAHAAAEWFVSKGIFKQAIVIYEHILEIIPDEVNSIHHIGQILQNAERYKDAIKYFLRGSAAFPNQLEFKIRLGECYFHIGHYEDALSTYREALKSVDKASKDVLESIQVWIGKCLYAKGDPSGISTIMAVLQQNEDNIEALIAYGNILYDKRNYSEAAKVFLKLLVLKSDHTEVREGLTKVVKLKDGVELIERELTTSPSTAPALAFLAMLVKDYGAVRESCTLYQHALQLLPDNTAYCLSYVHTLEVCNEYQKAFDVLKSFCKSNPTIAVNGFTCKDMYECIADLHDIYSEEEIQHASKKSLKFPSPSSQETPYNNDELDLLALFYTLVKILYIVGAMEMIPVLNYVIEPLRGTNRDLHLTSIRNENAYYCCICQLMDYHALPLPKLNYLYVAGDSHCLSTGWQTLNFKGEQKILKPMLVTGLKAWHLRPQSKFFPKMNFYNVINAIPSNSHVLFLFGEIDCREGLVVSVEKCRYKDVEEGAAVTIDIYLSALLKVVKEKNFTAYIHPVVPVLNETRHIVKMYNRILKEKVEQCPSLHWLDLFDHLLSADGSDFNRTYELDGTHLSPKYIPLLEEALKPYN